ncbi:lysozyme inhibitor LprI family protein [Rhizorhabdus argentea]|uniref:lysozyme inhibitor LprI family protein n=1 Tax=Rhizorhabdus argentea TaxID=1387174 RepID=UPI0030EE9484
MSGIHLRIAVTAVAALLAGCDRQPSDARSPGGAETAIPEKLHRICSSQESHARLKAHIFSEARRIGHRKIGTFDRFAQGTVMRVERPGVNFHDPQFEITVCRGRMILEVPAGTEQAFDGRRQLIADINYAARAAPDGSGLIDRVAGAGTVIDLLARADLAEPTAAPATSAPPLSPRGSAPEPAPAINRVERLPAESDSKVAAKQPTGRKESEDKQTEKRKEKKQEKDREKDTAKDMAVQVKPSFPCRYARSDVEKMICTTPELARLDRRMASQYDDAHAAVDAKGKRKLQRSREEFIKDRDRCRDAECVGDIYRGRMDEIHDIERGRSPEAKARRFSVGRVLKGIGRALGAKPSGQRDADNGTSR